MNDDEEHIVALTRKVYESTRKALQRQPPQTAMMVLILATQMLLCAAADAYETDPEELIDEFCTKLKNITDVRLN